MLGSAGQGRYGSGECPYLRDGPCRHESAAFDEAVVVPEGQPAEPCLAAVVAGGLYIAASGHAASLFGKAEGLHQMAAQLPAVAGKFLSGAGSRTAVRGRIGIETAVYAAAQHRQRQQKCRRER